MFWLKNMNFCVLNFADQHCLNCSCIQFRDLSEILQNLNLLKRVCVCVCVCVCVFVWCGVCVCVCVCVCVYKCDKSKQCYSCHMQNTTSRITLRNVTKFQKFRNWKFEKFITYTRRKTLPAWNVVTFPCRLKNCIH